MPDEKVAIFGPAYGVGGGGHVCSDVGKALGRKGYDVDFLIDGRYAKGGYLEEGLPDYCSIVRITNAAPQPTAYNLQYYGALFWSLLGYLRDNPERVLLSNYTKNNLLSIWASFLSGRRIRSVLVEHASLKHRFRGARQILSPLVQSFYPLSERIIGVSDDVTQELVKSFKLNSGSCTTIPNPIDLEQIAQKAEESVSHPWFSGDTHVVVGVGRFVPIKQYSLLLQAFENLTHRTYARLVMIGSGPCREALEEQVQSLGVTRRVDFLSATENPYRYMKKADLLAHSSTYEGFGLVLVEALATGTPVVATDCPGGPSDILNDGEYGELVDVGDPQGLADAMVRTLENPPDPDRLVERAQNYRVDKVANRYAEVIDQA